MRVFTVASHIIFPLLSAGSFVYGRCVAVAGLVKPGALGPLLRRQVLSGFAYSSGGVLFSLWEDDSGRKDEISYRC